MFLKFHKNIDNSLKRAEEIKQKLQQQESSKLLLNNNQQNSSTNNNINIKLTARADDSNQADDFQDDNETENNRFMNKLTQNLANNKNNSSLSFSAHEISVLRHGSFINKREYVPFFPAIDAKEKFFFSLAFSDKNGRLALSPSQSERFVRWSRPDEMFERPCLMMQISCFSVKQTCISDCSFVASLTVCAQYERKFNKKILSK